MIISWTFYAETMWYYDLGHVSANKFHIFWMNFYGRLGFTHNFSSYVVKTTLAVSMFSLGSLQRCMYHRTTGLANKQGYKFSYLFQTYFPGSYKIILIFFNSDTIGDKNCETCIPYSIVSCWFYVSGCMYQASWVKTRGNSGYLSRKSDFLEWRFTKT